MSVYLFRLDANTAIGYGHLARLSVLAEELTRRGHALWFASRDRLDKTHWFRPQWRFMPLESAHDFYLLAEKVCPDVIVCDLPVYDKAKLARLRAQFPLAVLDDYQTEPLPADLLINTQILWRDAPADAHQHVLGGAGYALVRPQGHAAKHAHPRRDLILTLGGSDPNDLTSRVVHWLRDLSAPITMTIVQGPGYRHKGALHAALTDYPHEAHVATHVTRMAPLLATHKLAVAAVGVTLYELAALGLPALVVVEEERQAPLAAAMERAGSLRAFSLASAKNGELAAAVKGLLQHPTRRAALARAGRRLVDGKGAVRLADALEALTRRRELSELERELCYA